VKPYEAALLCEYAESMYRPGVLNPTLDPRCLDYTIESYITGRDALFCTQALQLGEVVFYGFVAVSKVDGSRVAVIRGTATAREWLIDAEGFMVPTPFGGVEQGFYSVANTLTLSFDKSKPITFVGHSLGAALATYLTYNAAITGCMVKGMFFASPKPGNSTFAQTFDSIVGRNNYVTYTYKRDMVPHTPPSLFGFKTLSNEQILPPCDAIRSSLACNHHATTYAKLLGAELKTDCDQ